MLVKFTHANLKRDVFINPNLIEAFHWNETTKCMVVYTSKFGAWPVTETEEELIKKLSAVISGEGPNGKRE